MAIIATEDFEGGTLNGTVTTGNTTAFDYVRNSPTYTDGIVGDLAMRCYRETASDQYARVAFPARDTVYIRTYYTRGVSGTNDALRLLSSAPAIVSILRVNGSGQVQIVPQGSSILDTSPSLIGVGETARIEWAVTPTTQQSRVYVGANMHGGTPDYDSGPLATTLLASFIHLSVGIASTLVLPSPGVVIDALVVDSSEWPGTAVEPDPEPEPSQPRTHWGYDGTNLIPLTLHAP